MAPQPCSLYTGDFAHLEFWHFWTKKWCEKYYVLHYFWTWSLLVTFGPKNDAKRLMFYTTFRHGRKWKKPMSKSSVKRNTFCNIFRTKSDQKRPCRKVVWNVILFASLFGPKVTKVGPWPKVVWNVILLTASLQPVATAEVVPGRRSKVLRFTLLLAMGPLWSLLVRKVMRKVLRFTLLFDMVTFGHFWSEKPCE